MYVFWRLQLVCLRLEAFVWRPSTLQSAVCVSSGRSAERLLDTAPTALQGLHTSAAASKPASPALITNTAGDFGGAGGGVVSSGVPNDLRASRTESCCTMAQAAAAVYGSRTAAWGAAMPSATGAAAPPRISVTPAAGTMRLQ